MNNIIEIRSSSNIQTEILFVGSLYVKPDLYVHYGNVIRSQYDFSDPVSKFFYDQFETMYSTFSQKMDETQVNIFMTQDDDRLKTYKRYKGWKTISQWMNLANIDDFENYYEILKKYSLVREYERQGYPVQRILNHPKFEQLKAKDIYRLIRSKADKIHTVINAGEESVNITANMQSFASGFLIRPDFGLPLPWRTLNNMYKGLRLGKVYFNGFLSNEGKTRNLVYLIAQVVLVHEESFLMLANEMSEQDIKSCLLTTVINSPELKKLIGIDIDLTERELTLGLYKDSTGEYIKRKADKDGNWIESEQDFIARIEAESSTYNAMLAISEWIEERIKSKFLFKDVGADYSDSTLEFEIRKAAIIHNVKYFGYDTLKCYGVEDWGQLKQTATKLKELCKEIDVCLWATYQLADSAVFTDIFDFSSNLVASSKAIKHVADMMSMGKRLDKDDYHKYRYYSNENWGEPTMLPLDTNKKYFAIKVDKNRGGDKASIPLFEIDLDRNLWLEVGVLVKAPKTPKENKKTN